jgi:hypothetical protein
LSVLELPDDVSMLLKKLLFRLAEIARNEVEVLRERIISGLDKDYGHIVDFKELFGDVQQAIAVYSSDELDVDEGGGGDNNVKLKNWMIEGKAQLDTAREALHYLCQPVPQPGELEQFIHTSAATQLIPTP